MRQRLMGTTIRTAGLGAHRVRGAEGLWLVVRDDKPKTWCAEIALAGRSVLVDVAPAHRTSLWAASKLAEAKRGALSAHRL